LHLPVVTSLALVQGDTRLLHLAPYPCSLRQSIPCRPRYCMLLGLYRVLDGPCLHTPVKLQTAVTSRLSIARIERPSGSWARAVACALQWPRASMCSMGEWYRVTIANTLRALRGRRRRTWYRRVWTDRPIERSYAEERMDCVRHGSRGTLQDETSTDIIRQVEGCGSTTVPTWGNTRARPPRDAAAPP
jgi:hypothetical protein